MKLPEWLAPWRRKAIGPLDLALDIVGRKSKSGAVVNWRTALEVTTVLACARVIAEGIAQVPLKLFQDTGMTRLPATEHPMYRLLHRRPNGWQTSFEFRETLGMHLVLTGGAYAYKNRHNGTVLELVQFEPQHVVVNRLGSGTLTYDVTNPANGSKRTFAADEIWHIKGPSWNGYLGLEAVQFAREAIGLAAAAEESHAGLHRQGVQTSGIYSMEGALNREQFKALREWIEMYHAGSENAGRPFILDRSAKWISQTMSGVDAQHLETRRHQVEEICRALRVMPIMVGYSDKASTYASAEQMFLAHVVHTLAPWYERIEQSICANLLTEADERNGIYAKFVTAGLLRGSLKDTKDYLLGLVNGGLMTPNEGRDKLELNPDPDPESDRLRLPVNVVADPAEADS